MKRYTIMLITLIYVFGTFGMPVVAYSCVESAETGLVTYHSGSPRSCYADSCCDDDQDPPNVRFESETSCCDLSVQVTPENGILLPGHKYGQANRLAEAPARFDASQPETGIAPTLPPVSIHHTSINLPLLF